MRNPPALLSSKKIRNALQETKHIRDMDMGDSIQAYVVYVLCTHVKEDIMELLHRATSTSLFTESQIPSIPYSHKDCETPCLAHRVVKQPSC